MNESGCGVDVAEAPIKKLDQRQATKVRKAKYQMHKCQTANAKCQIPDAKCQIPNANANPIVIGELTVQHALEHPQHRGWYQI